MSYFRGLRSGIAAVAAIGFLLPAVAPAAITVTYGSRDGGAAAFDDIVELGGDTPSTLLLGDFDVASSLTFGDITITRNNGGTIFSDGVYQGYSTVFPNPNEQTTGHTINVNPYQGENGAIDSGLTFSFANPVNAFGFEVGDWGTCCQPSALYMSFDDGAPIQVGLSQVFGDTFETNGAAIVFVGAFDDSGAFSKVQFWGDGYGEYLVAGGTLRSANLDFGTLGDGSSVLRPLLPEGPPNADGGFNFDFEVLPDQQIWIDPDVAVGYTYNITSGPTGGYFATAEFENLGDGAYDILDLNGNLLFDDFNPGLGNIVDFVAGGFTGLTGFKVEGIDTALMLNPDSPLAFKTGLTFAGYSGNGEFTVSQTPQTEFVGGGGGGAVPEPSTWAMLMLGFGLVGAAARRRRTGIDAIA